MAAFKDLYLSQIKLTHSLSRQRTYTFIPNMPNITVWNNEFNYYVATWCTLIYYLTTSFIEIYYFTARCFATCYITAKFVVIYYNKTQCSVPVIYYITAARAIVYSV